MHECGAGGLSTRKFTRESIGGYSGSRYLLPDVPRGEIVGKFVSCQDIQDLTFADDSFDLFVTQDVLEHVLRPERRWRDRPRAPAWRCARVRVPIYYGRRTLVRAVPSGAGIE